MSEVVTRQNFSWAEENYCLCGGRRIIRGRRRGNGQALVSFDCQCNVPFPKHGKCSFIITTDDAFIIRPANVYSPTKTYANQVSKPKNTVRAVSSPKALVQTPSIHPIASLSVSSSAPSLGPSIPLAAWPLCNAHNTLQSDAHSKFSHRSPFHISYVVYSYNFYRCDMHVRNPNKVQVYRVQSNQLTDQRSALPSW